MESKTDSVKTPAYNDLYFRIAISLLAAHFIIAFGIDKTIWELLLMTAYYRALAGSFIIAFLLVSTVYWVTVKLDKNWLWGKNNLVRIIYQAAFGVILPSAFAFILAAIYFALYRINILKTPYLKYDFPVIVIFIILINTYYFAYYHYLLSRQSLIADGNEETRQYQRHQFIVTEGSERIPVKTGDIGYFYRDGNFNWLKTIEGSTYLHELTLDETEGYLDPQQFFRANRQAIVNHDACKSYQLLEYGKLEVLVEPAMHTPVIISQKKAADFKRWMDR